MTKTHYAIGQSLPPPPNTHAQLMDIFKVVHLGSHFPHGHLLPDIYVAHTSIGKQAVGLQLKGFLIYIDYHTLKRLQNLLSMKYK